MKSRYTSEELQATIPGDWKVDLSMTSSSAYAILILKNKLEVYVFDFEISCFNDNLLTHNLFSNLDQVKIWYDKNTKYINYL